MKVKTRALTGRVLDFVVATIQFKANDDETNARLVTKGDPLGGVYRPTENDAQAMAIIDQADIATWPDQESTQWFASVDGGRGEDCQGDTSDIAAMRSYVASQKGEEVEISDDILAILQG